MFGKKFELNEQTIPVVEEIGRHMPGGFFIYKADKPEEVIYANRAVFEIFGCKDAEDFKALTGNTFRGMLHPEDYEKTEKSIDNQIGQVGGRLRTLYIHPGLRRNFLCIYFGHHGEKTAACHRPCNQKCGNTGTQRVLSYRVVNR